ncbi:MAG TPA: alkaline phosphatase family protein [Candidatus Tumulicola sp.]
MKKIALVLIATLASGCGSSALQGAANALVPHGIVRGHSASPIQHVIVIMQENRSFDNFFYDFPGANGASSGMGHGVQYTLQPLPLAWSPDQYHSHWQFLEDFDGGKNDGFDRSIHAFATSPKRCTIEPEDYPECWIYYKPQVWKQMPYSYVPEKQIEPYWTMAKQYTLGDDSFSSNSGESFPSHQYMIAGQSGHSSEVPSNMPWGCDAPKESEYYLEAGASKPPSFPPAFGHEVGYPYGPEPGPDPCFPLDANPSSAYPTIADLLDQAGISWRYYVQPHVSGPEGDSYWLNAFDAVKAIRYGPDWDKNFSKPDTNVLTDIASGDLQQVTWVMPHGGASDHAGGGTGYCGPNWVASIVDAVGQSQYWNSTAIIVMWDEWGGWYDHVVPPQYHDPRTKVYEGLGFRVPLLVISPYAKAHYISHRQHEIASTLRYIEQTFGLPFLGTGSGFTYADQRADAFDDVFDYTQKPLKFKKIALLTGKNYKTCANPWDFVKRQWPPEEDY